MTKPNILSLALVAGFAISPLMAAAQNAAPAQQAAPQITPEIKAMLDATVPVANQFVMMLDGKQFPEAMALADDQFKKSLGNQNMATIIGDFQAKNGAVKTRNIVGAAPVTPPADPSVPKGRYAGVQYVTDFATSGQHTETVILFENNKVWKVAGYFSNPVPPQAPAAAN